MENYEFKLLSRDEELEILEKDDKSFTRTTKYLEPWITQVLKKQNLDDGKFAKLYAELISDISVAARRFLENYTPDKTYKFSTYFGWYIAQRINKTAE